MNNNTGISLKQADIKLRNTWRYWRLTHPEVKGMWIDEDIYKLCQDMRKRWKYDESLNHKPQNGKEVNMKKCAKKAVAKKPAAKKVVAKKTTTKKAAVKKPVAKAAAPKKSVKKAVAKKVTKKTK